MTDQFAEGKNIQPDCSVENPADDNITEEKESQQSSPGSGSDAVEPVLTPNNAGVDVPTNAPANQSDAEQQATALGNANTETSPDTSQNPSGQATSPINCPHYDIGNPVGDCTGHHAGLLTGREIDEYGLIGDLFEKKCLQTTSYDLRLGEEHMVYDTIKEKWSTKWVRPEKAPDDKIPTYECDNTYLVIPRFGMALVQLREEIDLLSCIKLEKQPVMICGHFDLKLSCVRKGLVSQQATQVEPGYKGKLFCYLFNQTGEDITLSYTDGDARIATIEFQFVSCLSQCDPSLRESFLEEHPKKHKKYLDNPFCGDHGIDDVRFFDGKLPHKGGLASIEQILKNAENNAYDNAFEGCGKAIKFVKDEQALMWKVVFSGVAAIVTLMAVLVPLFFSLNSEMSEKLAKMQDLIDDARAERKVDTTDASAARAELTSVTTEAKATQDALTAVQVEAQTTYDMIITMLSELDEKKKATDQPEATTAVEKKPVTRHETTEKGGKQ